MEVCINVPEDGDALSQPSAGSVAKELVKTNFFDYLDFALQFAPAQENEKEIRVALARIGVGPGKTLRPSPSGTNWCDFRSDRSSW